MARFLEFLTVHWALAGVFIGLLLALFWVESRRQGPAISAQQATRLINHEDALVVDLRDANDFATGHIAGARNIPLSTLSEHTELLKEARTKPVILVCQLGQHSGAAGKLLQQKGCVQVMRLSGGISGWLADKLPLVKT